MNKLFLVRFCINNLMIKSQEASIKTGFLAAHLRWEFYYSTRDLHNHAVHGFFERT